MATAKKPRLLRFCYSYLYLPLLKVCVTNDFTFPISVNKFSSKHSNLSFAYHFVIYLLLQNNATY